MQKLYFVIELYCIVLFLEQIKKKQKKTNNTIQHNNTIQFCRNLRFICRNCILLLNCIVLCCFWNKLKKNRKKPTTQYNTITQYNLVKFKDFLRKLYCVIELYCIVLFLEQIKKKEKNQQHNTTQ